MSRDIDMSSPSIDQQESSSQVSPDSDSTGDCQQNESCKEPGPNDVLCGRGGSINSHPGNERFRNLVEKRKRVYLTARFKREKRLIASSIVSEIRGLNPPGRFLQHDKKSGLWRDIGDEKARDKTSQALRENAPSLRAEIETEINEQRAEMKKEEDDSYPAPPQIQPAPTTSYYQPGWAPSYPSYYGYSHAPAPPVPHPAYFAPSTPTEGFWAWYPGAPPPSHGLDHHALQQKSAFEQTADYISSGAQSIRRWTDSTFSLSSNPPESSHAADPLPIDEIQGADSSSGSVSASSSKPLTYVHHDDSKKRRMVKFRSDTKKHAKRKLSGRLPLSSSYSLTSGNSLIDSTVLQSIEPHDLTEVHDDPNSSLMDQFSTQLLASLGSWEAGNMCGVDTTEKPRPSFRLGAGSKDYQDLPHEQDEDMAVEWEGQEVQLIDQTNDFAGVLSEEQRMPPPARGFMPEALSSVGGYGSVAMSSLGLGSCHSWLPEQVSAAASYFSGRDEGVVMETEGSIGALEHHSMTSGLMLGDHSATGSIGGASLTRVFENEPLPDAPTSGPRVLASMPSWERNLRARSPLSMESDEEDISLISKESSKLSVDHFGPHPPPLPPGNGMNWERKE